jgi:hypothetical protein
VAAAMDHHHRRFSGGVIRRQRVGENRHALMVYELRYVFHWSHPFNSPSFIPVEFIAKHVGHDQETGTVSITSDKETVDLRPAQ